MYIVRYKLQVDSFCNFFRVKQPSAVAESHAEALTNRQCGVIVHVANKRQPLFLLVIITCY